jgi:hypothetical protein
MELKIKKAYEGVQIGYNNSCLPLGKRNDLHKLYELAKANKNQRILNMFETQPTLAELQEIKAQQFDAKQAVNKISQPTGGDK